MSDAGRLFERAYAERTRAKARLDLGVARVREDLAARGVVGRVLDTAVDEAADAAFEAIEVARANKAVVGGTVAALAAWLLRAPIASVFTSVVDRFRRA